MYVSVASWGAWMEARRRRGGSVYVRGDGLADEAQERELRVRKSVFSGIFESERRCGSLMWLLDGTDHLRVAFIEKDSCVMPVPTRVYCLQLSFCFYLLNTNHIYCF
jgi:hypothetical protein